MEKNPCAIVVLAAQVREVWRDRDVVVIPGDMRHIDFSPKADIIVSELLGLYKFSTFLYLREYYKVLIKTNLQILSHF